MPLRTREIRLMGTHIQMSIYHQDPEPILDEGVRLLHLYNQRFSANDPQSELAVINQKSGLEAVSVHSELFELISLGKKHSLAPDSWLNIALGPLVQTWRIVFADAKVPSQDDLTKSLSLTDPADILLQPHNQSIFLKKTGMKIDLGAIAKGYIADQIIKLFKSLGAPAGLINLGGNVLTFGPAYHSLDHLWRVGLQDPQLPRGNHLVTLAIRDQSVVTSGTYERHLKDGSRNYHHILDKKTGYPIQSPIRSLTIISTNSVDGDIWTSRLFGAKIETILSQAQHRKFGAIVVTKKQQVLANSLAKSYILPTSKIR